MRYVGSKRLLVKYIKPIIQDLIEQHSIQTYVEPFVGGCNMIEHIECEHRIGADINDKVIAMWQALQNGWQPPMEVSEEEYKTVKDDQDRYPPEYVAFVGIGCSWGGRFFEGYARSIDSKGEPRNYAAESCRAIKKSLPKLRDVEFKTGNYCDFRYNNALIYCDPPYMSSKKYYRQDFNYDMFWDWCRQQTENNILLISQYTAPPDFQCIWSKNIKCMLSTNNYKDKTERLYMLGSQAYKLSVAQ